MRINDFRQVPTFTHAEVIVDWSCQIQIMRMTTFKRSNVKSLHSFVYSRVSAAKEFSHSKWAQPAPQSLLQKWPKLLSPAVANVSPRQEHQHMILSFLWASLIIQYVQVPSFAVEGNQNPVNTVFAVPCPASDEESIMLMQLHSKCKFQEFIPAHWIF